jgi:hypothetical protein
MHSHGPEKSVHNMVVVGERRIFLSHLPMFMPPHDAQVIVEATFMKDGRSVDDVYVADRARNGQVRFYTLQPQPFVLQDLVFPTAPLTHFTATVFRGHLEKGGVAIEGLTNVDVHVKQVVHSHGFQGADKQKTLTYVMFGGGDERFLAHFITKAPDFDQLLSVTLTGQRPAPEQLQRGATVEVEGRGVKPADRLEPKQSVPARGHVTGVEQSLDLHVTVNAELYFEEGELMSTMNFDTTAEERKAGFE